MDHAQDRPLAPPGHSPRWDVRRGRRRALVDAIKAEGGEVSLHFERVPNVTPEAAEEIKRRLDEMWESGEVRPLMVWFHVLPEKRGDMADTLERAGFDMEREGPYEVIYMGPPSTD